MPLFNLPGALGPSICYAPPPTISRASRSSFSSYFANFGCQRRASSHSETSSWANVVSDWLDAHGFGVNSA
ncbi:hypothetical protein TNCV_2199721 [Trichonephila clavipes]|nr:hypothetical protein TNCV_2199721 [Trichonephila clavipes]